MDPATGGSSLKRPKDPNFYAVIVLSIVALLVIFAVAWFLVMRHGRQIVPSARHSNQPNTSWTAPANTTPPTQRQI